MPSGGVVDATFARIAAVLDDGAVSTWRRAQLEQLLERIIAHYAHTQRTNGDNNDTHNSNDKHNNSNNDGACTDGGQTCERRRDAVAAVDRDLVRVRQLLHATMPPYTTTHASCRSSSSSAVASPPPPLQHQQPSSSSAPPPPTPLPVPTYDVDAFLYTTDDVDALVQRGDLPRHYCRRCGAHDVGDVDWVTHSLTQDEVVYMAAYLLSALSSRTHHDDSSSNESSSSMPCRVIVDVGSRLGAVLWACWSAQRRGLLPHTRRIVGVEVDAVYARAQRDVYAQLTTTMTAEHEADANTTLTKRDDNDGGDSSDDDMARVEIVESDCFVGDGAAALRAADVVVLHNVFEYFCNDAVAHVRAWRQLRALVCRRGQLLVCKPSLQSTLLSLSVDALQRGGLLQPSSSSSLSGEREDDAHATAPRTCGGKRARDSDDCALQHVDAVQQWLSSYVVEVDVADVAAAFVRERAGDVQRNNNDDDSDSDDDSDDLPERIAGIHVYRVV